MVNNKINPNTNSEYYSQLLEMKTISSSKFELLLKSEQKLLRKVSKCSLNTEYNLLSQCRHPNIIQAYEQDSEKSYIMEYCPRGDLNTNEFKNDWIGVSFIFNQMCQAVKYLHDAGICHLDIKLTNFVRDQQGTVKLIDFGHAMSAQELICKVAGTREYNAAERYSGIYDGKKADVFSLAICLVGLFLGTVPCGTGKEAFVLGRKFRNSDKAWAEIERKYLEGNKIDCHALELVEWMVKPNPDERPGLDDD